MVVEQLATVRDLDRAEWDELAGDQIFSSHGWLRTVEETYVGPQTATYFVIRRGGVLDAAAACYLQTPGTDGLDLALFGRFARIAKMLGLNVAPALVCASRTGLGGHVLAKRGSTRAERDSWTAALLDALEAHARHLGVTLCLRNVPDASDPSLLETLRLRGYLRASEMPYTCMDVGWASFGDYVRALKKTHPRTAKNIRREVRRAQIAGLVYERIDGAAPDFKALHELLDAQQRRLNGHGFPYRSDFLDVLGEQLAERLTLYVARKDGEPISVVVGLRGGDSLYLPMVGMDAARQRETGVYFNNSYNVPIGDAITRGMRKVYCGKLVYDLKLRRGFRLLPLSMYLRVPGRAREAALRAAMLAQHLRMRAMFATLDAPRRKPTTS